MNMTYDNMKFVCLFDTLPSFGLPPISLDAVWFKTLQSFASLMPISSIAMSPRGDLPRTATNDTF